MGWHVRNLKIHSMLMSCVTPCYVRQVIKEMMHSLLVSCVTSCLVRHVRNDVNAQLAHVMCYILVGLSCENNNAHLLRSCVTSCLVCHVRKLFRTSCSCHALRAAWCIMLEMKEYTAYSCHVWPADHQHVWEKVCNRGNSCKDTVWIEPRLENAHLQWSVHLTRY